MACFRLLHDDDDDIANMNLSSRSLIKLLFYVTYVMLCINGT